MKSSCRRNTVFVMQHAAKQSSKHTANRQPTSQQHTEPPATEPPSRAIHKQGNKVQTLVVAMVTAVALQQVLRLVGRLVLIQM